MSRAETDKKVRELFDRRLAESKSQTLVGKTREEVLNQIEKMKKYYVPDIPEEFAAEKEFMLKAVEINGESILQASDELKRDGDLILAAAKEISPIFLEIPKELLGDRNFVLRLLCRNGLFFGIAVKCKKEYAFDKDMILTAVKQNFEAARYVKPRFFDEDNPMCDKNFVMELVGENGRALSFVYPPFRDDEEVVLAAAKNYRSFEFASVRLKNDEKFLMRVLDINPSCIAYAPIEYRKNKTLIAELMKKHAYVYRYAREDAKNDLNMALEAVKSDGRVFEYVPKKLRESAEFTERLKECIESHTVKKEDEEYLKEEIDWILNPPSEEDMFKNVITLVDKKSEK